MSSSLNSYQERNSAHPATADHILPIEQSNVPKETSPLKDNPNANCATSILDEGIKQTHQFPTDAPGHPESLRYLPPATKSQRQSASPTRAKNESDVNRRFWNQEDVTILQPTGSTPFVQDSLFSSLVTTIEKIGISHDFPTTQIMKFDGSP